MSDRFAAGIPVPLVSDSGHSKMAEATDPYEANAVLLSTPGHDGMGEMARAFVEEFALMGWPPDRIERMFRIPRYAAAHAVYATRGAGYVAGIVDDVFGRPTGGSGEKEV